ncbi:MAG: metalloregulator ArsR/SmtB family transcription factor [Candidatus Zixiibacteriota bacterium]
MSRARETKDKLYAQFARLGHALSSPKRLELLDLLCQSEKTVETLAEQSSMSVANTSRHLQVLRAARLVEGRKDGVFVHYHLTDTDVCKVFVSLRNLADNHMAEIDRIVADFFDTPARLQPIDRRRLLQRARAGEVVILDVRPEDEYNAAHLPYAVSMPLAQLRKRLKEFSPGKEIVAYCRGPYCVLAQEAISLLRSKGLTAKRLEDGVTEWRQAGMPVSTEQMKHE